MDSLRIEDIGLTDYTVKLLKEKHDINTVGDLLSRDLVSPEALEALDGIGPKTSDEILTAHTRAWQGANHSEVLTKTEEPKEEPSPKEDTKILSLRYQKIEEERERANQYNIEAISKVEEEIEPILVEVIEHTKKARDAMDTDPVDTNTLANEEVELSILLQRLSERIARAGYNERSASNQLDDTRESLKVYHVEEEGDTASLADSKKKTETKEEFEIWNHAKYIFDNVNLTRKSTDKTIDTIRSKLSHAKILEQR